MAWRPDMTWVGVGIVFLAGIFTVFNIVCTIAIVWARATESEVALQLEDPQWEGLLWKDSNDVYRGIAVRRKYVRSLRGYTMGDKTPWGVCHLWSVKSKGKYCFIDADALSPSGFFVFYDALHFKDYKAIP